MPTKLQFSIYQITAFTENGLLILIDAEYCFVRFSEILSTHVILKNEHVRRIVENGS
jgi:hypothetical protein